MWMKTLCVIAIINVRGLSRSGAPGMEQKQRKREPDFTGIYCFDGSGPRVGIEDVDRISATQIIERPTSLARACKKTSRGLHRGALVRFQFFDSNFFVSSLIRVFAKSAFQ